MRKALLIIDPQNDFCHPEGSLYVDGADNDMESLAKFIGDNENEIDGIITTMDSHYVMDISHPYYWVDFEGQHPEPFTQITHKEVKGRKYRIHMPGVEDPDIDKAAEEKQKMAAEYLKNLESLEKFTHTIWPEHCLVGSWGHMIYQDLLNSILHWSRTNGKDYQTIFKGNYQHSEHFGAFEAEVPDPNVPETMLKGQTLQYLDSFDKVYLLGEAKTHCVAHTLDQLIDCVEKVDAPDIVDRYVIVEDCMSPVKGFEEQAQPIFYKAKEMGFQFCKLQDINLENE